MAKTLSKADRRAAVLAHFADAEKAVAADLIDDVQKATALISSDVLATNFAELVALADTLGDLPVGKAIAGLAKMRENALTLLGHEQTRMAKLLSTEGAN